MARHGSTYLAGKAIVVSLAAIAASLVLSRMALPRLSAVLGEMGAQPPGWAMAALQFQNELPLLPVPGLLLGIAALMFRPFRTPLAVAAMLAAVAATAMIVAMLVGTLVPFYGVRSL